MWDEMGGGVQKNPKMTFNCSESSKHNSLVLISHLIVVKVPSMEQNVKCKVNLILNSILYCRMWYHVHSKKDIMYTTMTPV